MRKSKKAMLFNDKHEGGEAYKAIIGADNRYKMQIEDLWGKFREYSPKKFISRFRKSNDSNFYGIIWEMLLANRFLEKDFELEKVSGHGEPDICVNKNGKKIWFECSVFNEEIVNKILKNKTTGVQTAAASFSGSVDFSKIKQNILRKLRKKHKQHKEWVENNFLIIALNGIFLRRAPIDKIMRDVLLESAYGGKDRPFCEENYGSISGILYSTESWFSPLEDFNRIQQYYIFLPNINAKNHLPIDLGSFCQVVKDDDIREYLKKSELP